MVKNGYLSRNVSDRNLFEQVLQRRLEAKRTGDKKTANALKLCANTAFGCSNNQYNEMFDPLMARSICITGQLYLIQLIVMLGQDVDNFYLLQVNTDGVMFYVSRKQIRLVRAIVHEWETITHMSMEETEIDSVVQRDVNNYIMRETSGKIKVKGGVVSDYNGGDFKHNSMSIVCKAIVDNLLDGVDIDKTINECNDIFAFQMIVKAGGSYEKVVHSTGIGDVEVNRTNRIFAGKDERLGSVYKIKSDGRKDKVANCPEHAIVDNSGTVPIDKIDKNWYIELATERINQFKGIKPERRKKCTKTTKSS